jgi:hypothetical protein
LDVASPQNGHLPLIDAGALVQMLAKESLPECGDSIVDLFDASLQSVIVEQDDLSTTGAGHLRVRLEPTNFLFGLVAAAWARDVDHSVIKEAHRGSPVSLATVE